MIAELLALVVLIIIAYGLLTLIPQLGTFADELYQLYYGEIVRELGLIRRNGPDKPAPAQNPAQVPAPGSDEPELPKI